MRKYVEYQSFISGENTLNKDLNDRSFHGWTMVSILPTLNPGQYLVVMQIEQQTDR